jgi:peptidoglycan/LPS O-acetylase OafA/YrhL
MRDPAGSARYDALDCLRASMMLLGVVFHAALPYTTLPIWYFKDARTEPAFDFVVLSLHAFRMPLFFVMAGFFGALLYDRRGPGGLIRNRVVRILLPLAVGWIVLGPLVRMGLRFARTVDRSGSLAAGLEAIDVRHLVSRQPYHLWFLADLLLYYAAAVGLAWALRRLRPGTRQRLDGLVRSTLRDAWRPIPLALSTLALLGPCAWQHDHDDLEGTLCVQGALFLFFGFGWLVHVHRDLLATFPRHAWQQIAMAVILLAVPVTLARQALASPAGGEPVVRVAIAGTASVAVWLLVVGIMGVFLRHLNRPIATLRYLSDGSYWIYLIHLPLVVWAGGVLAVTAMPAWAKLLVTLAVTTPIMLVTYHYGVRFTALGTVLGGTRTPRVAKIPVLAERGP